MKLRSGRRRIIMPSNFAIIVILTFPPSLYGNIDKYFHYYETLHHDSFRHHVARRDLYSANPSERSVEFDSHGKHFKLVLHKEKSMLTEDFAVTVVNKDGVSSMKFNPATYQGYLEDEPTTSSVTAYWDDGTDEFTATISTESDVYTVEPSWRYLPKSDDYNLISYRGSDMKRDENLKHPNCANFEKIMKNEMNNSNSRNKRSDTSSKVHFVNKTCVVRLVADYRFHQRVGAGDISKTARYLMRLMEGVDSLFRIQTFDECGDGFGFQIGNITIHNSFTNREYHYNSHIVNWELPETLLEAFTHNEAAGNSRYCLSHLFTATTFPSNVFGVAYLAEPNSGFSGICSIYRNTGWTTFVDRDSNLISTLQARLVTAHEFGHGWGSHHDQPGSSSSTCTPRDAEGGKYIMFTSSVNGIQPNNMKFSSCSKAEICKVLNSNARACFSGKSDCMNYKRDSGEQCDEGPVPEYQKCCTGTCQWKSNAICSDVNDKCCVNCQYANSSKICHTPDYESCTATTYCSGNSSECPALEIAPDGTDCQTEFGVRGTCRDGNCTSLCEAAGSIPCLCDSEISSCKVCCRNLTNSGNCTEFFNGAVNVSNNTPCPVGICVNGVCQRLTAASLVRPWNFISFESVAGFVKFMKNNIVGSVIIISLLLWIPASCAVSSIDRKRSRAEFKAEWHTMIMSHLIPPSEQSHTKIRMTTGTIDRRRTEKNERPYK